jgi:predicted nucleic acid-binding protein
VDWLARTRKVSDATDRILASVEDESLIVVEPDADDYVRIRWLVGRYANLPLSLVDASVVAIAERLEQTRIATLDRRLFGAVRPLNVPAFELVP